MKTFPDKYFKFHIKDRVYINNTLNLSWLKSPEFLQAAHAEQPLYILDRTANENGEVFYTLSFFPVIIEHNFETNLAYILNEIMCSKDKETGKVRVSDYFSAFQRSKHFILTEVQESAIIRSY